MGDTVVLRGRIATDKTIRGRVSMEGVIKGQPLQIMPVFPPEYDGPLTVTPGPEAQTLATAELVVPVDIIIEPIPSNYGLITWDGSTLTVS